MRKHLFCVFEGMKGSSTAAAAAATAAAADSRMSRRIDKCFAVVAGLLLLMVMMFLMTELILCIPPHPYRDVNGSHVISSRFPPFITMHNGSKWVVKIHPPRPHRPTPPPLPPKLEHLPPAEDGSGGGGVLF